MPIGRRKRPQHRYEPRVRINKFIRVPEVRVISSSGEQLGVLKTREAQNMAQDEELDLVEVAPNENPPVCRIMDFGKYLYDEKKK
ncbi:MAG: translation initiation factor IF-3, partial [bacterium]